MSYGQVSRDPLLSRRQVLAAATAASAAIPLAALAAESAGVKPSSRMGIVTYALGIRQRADKTLSDPLAFLKECHRLGAGGMQFPLGVRDVAYTTELRRFAEANSLHIESNIEMLASRMDLDRFERQILTAKAAGAQVIRTVLFPGRRYEQFTSAEQFREASKNAWAALQRAEPVARRHRFRMAIENHKDQRIGERLELLRKIDSEYIGVCVDLGNSIALCDDAMEVVRAFAPYCFSVHLKDQSVREYEDGFLLGDAALGDGCLDLPAMVKTIRQAHPEAKFNFEVITRDPLKVPVFTDQYWTTMRDVPAAELARTMRFVKSHASRDELPRISHLSLEQQVEAERGNVLRSIAYARERLQL